TVLFLDLLQPPQLAGAQPAIKLLPTIECLLRDPHPPNDLRHRRPRLRLLQRERNLLLGEPALLHGSAPPARVSQSRKTRIHAGGEKREDVRTTKRGQINTTQRAALISVHFNLNTRLRFARLIHLARERGQMSDHYLEVISLIERLHRQ